MKLFEYLENLKIKTNLISQLKDLLIQFNKDILTKEECIEQMKELIEASKFNWILDSLNDMQEPILYLQTLKGLL